MKAVKVKGPAFLNLLSVRTIISGGQTGADRAALDWAIQHGVKHGGFCPKGRRSEDGRVPDKYLLEELPAASYLARTERNVMAADGTLIITEAARLSGGSAKTAAFCRKHSKPFLHAIGGCEDIGVQIRAFIREHGIVTLNVAGPRASSVPRIEELVHRSLDLAFASADKDKTPVPAAKDDKRDLQELFFLAGQIENLSAQFATRLGAFSKKHFTGEKRTLLPKRCAEITAAVSTGYWNLIDSATSSSGKPADTWGH